LPGGIAAGVSAFAELVVPSVNTLKVKMVATPRDVCLIIFMMMMPEKGELPKSRLRRLENDLASA
jgi:hypothetical protein